MSPYAAIITNKSLTIELKKREIMLTKHYLPRFIMSVTDMESTVLDCSVGVAVLVEALLILVHGSEAHTH